MLYHFYSLIISLFFFASLAADTTGEQKKPLALLLFGPSGSGRGVLAVKVCNIRNMPHITTADLILDEINEGTELGAIVREHLNKSGSLSDELLMDLLLPRIKKADCSRGFLLNNLPKNIFQAEALKRMLGASHRIKALSIITDEEAIAHRISGRLVCQSCGRVYHKQLSPPKKAMICDHCGALLAQREDDSTMNIKRRLGEYSKTMEPVFAFYKKENQLEEIDGHLSFDKTFSLIIQASRPQQQKRVE